MDRINTLKTTGFCCSKALTKVYEADRIIRDLRSKMRTGIIELCGFKGSEADNNDYILRLINQFIRGPLIRNDRFDDMIRGLLKMVEAHNPSPTPEQVRSIERSIHDIGWPDTLSHLRDAQRLCQLLLDEKKSDLNPKQIHKLQEVLFDLQDKHI